MPLLGTMYIPPPTDWAEFEDLTRDALAIKWQSPGLQKNGRQGQSQAGVDVYGPDDLGRFVGVQCKETQKLTLAKVEAEAIKAEAFVPSLDTFYMATTMEHDASLQKEVRLLSEERRRNGKFPVAIFFWGDLQSELAKDERAFKKHYPQLALSAATSDIAGSRLLSALDFSYYGAFIRDYLGLIFGAIGMFVEDPHQLASLTSIVTACAQTLLADPEKTQVVQTARDLLDRALTANTPADWQAVDALARRIEGAADAAENRLTGRALAAYRCGRILGTWHFGERKVTKRTLDRFLTALGAASPALDLRSEVEVLVAEFNADASISAGGIPHRIYSLVRDALREQEMTRS